MEKLLLTIIPYILYRNNIYGFNILPIFLLEHHSFTPSQYSWQKKNNCISTDPNLPFPSPQHRVLQYCSTNHPHATLLPHTHIHITLKVKLRQTRLEQKNALADNRHNPKERNGGELRLLHRILVTTMAENYQSLLSFPRQETYGQQTHGLLRHFCKTYVCKKIKTYFYFLQSQPPPTTPLGFQLQQIQRNLSISFTFYSFIVFWRFLIIFIKFSSNYFQQILYFCY